MKTRKGHLLSSTVHRASKLQVDNKIVNHKMNKCFVRPASWSAFWGHFVSKKANYLTNKTKMLFLEPTKGCFGPTVMFLTNVLLIFSHQNYTLGRTVCYILNRQKPYFRTTCYVFGPTISNASCINSKIQMLIIEEEICGLSFASLVMLLSSHSNRSFF